MCYHIHMIKCRIADFNIIFHNRYEFVENLCRDYFSEFEQADFSIAASEDDIRREHSAVGGLMSLDYCEATCLYRNLCNEILLLDAFLLHGAAVEKDGQACIFLGKSGGGKSTHALLLTQYYPDLNIINIDKPIIRLIDGKFFAYGTPWCGKEGVQTDARAEVKAICFLEKAADNSICRIEDFEAVNRYFHQLLIPKEPQQAVKLLTLTDRFLRRTPAYLMRCSISYEAAQLSYNTLLETR
ncbi:MAG: hypothetical protein Q4C04_05935 [Clostridia bacterium]|nr:hypothetical protein [Clostridia bacterium]